MKKIFILLLTTYQISFAQEEKVLIPTPESSSLIKWAQNEVNYSSGALNTGIPIYTLKDGDLEVPIALHYNGSTGIKVDEAATWVGLGWDLLAGGKIVRIVRDKPDESFTMNFESNEKSSIFEGFSIGVSESPNQIVKRTLSWESEKIIYRGGWYINGNQESTQDFIQGDPALFDTEPDLFVVNINGDVIKFVFDEHRNPAAAARLHRVVKPQ